MRGYARSKKLDKDASNGKQGVDIGAVDQKGGEEWGAPYEGGWDEINSVDQRKGLKDKGKRKEGQARAMAKAKFEGKGQTDGVMFLLSSDEAWCILEEFPYLSDEEQSLFYKIADEHFVSAPLAADPQHPGCQIHCMVRRQDGVARVEPPPAKKPRTSKK